MTRRPTASQRMAARQWKREMPALIGCALAGAAVIIFAGVIVAQETRSGLVVTHDPMPTYRLDVIQGGDVYTVDSGLSFLDCRMARPDLADARCVREG